MNVLSLFDGISCGQLALQNSNIKYDKYFASEIDKHVISVTQKNFPNTIQVGDISNLGSKDFPKIDLLIGGSPCQGFSIAGKQLNFEDKKSKLFFEYLRILKETKPTHFLLENVSMKKEWIKIISDLLEVEPININSNLVSAQNRPRLYWTNIPNVTQPINKNIELSSIVQSQNDIIDYDKYLIPDTQLESLSKEVVFNGVFALTERRTEEAKRIRREYMKKYGKDFSPRRAKELFSRNDNKANCLTATIGKEHFIFDGQNIRYMTPIEWERLQTLPDDFTSPISNSQRYKAIGNGWTADVISHIFNNIQQ